MGNRQPKPKAFKVMIIVIARNDMGYIYIATSPSGKSYVGQTKYGVKERWRDHIYDALDPNKDHCKLLNRAIRKYGGCAFDIQVICECNDDDMNDLERSYIERHNTVKPNGYNLTHGGGSSCNHLEETKKKISEKLKGVPKHIDSLEKRSRTKKNNNGLPMYLIEYKKEGVVRGYRVTHPLFNERRFTSKCISLEENLANAKQYLAEINAKAPVQRLNGGG